MTAIDPTDEPDATGAEPAAGDDVARLLAFLRGRDVLCPVCRYNLRDLTRPECPECRQGLALTVGVTQPQFLWFLLAVAPCMFSAIAAILLLVPMTLQVVMGGGMPEPAIFLLDAVGWLSAIGGVLLVRRRFAFLRQAPGRQRAWAAGLWALHVLAFFAFLGAVMLL